MVLFFKKIESSPYLDVFSLWRKMPFKDIVYNTMLFCYNITIGHIPWVMNIWAPQNLANSSRIWGNALLMPVTIAFFIKIFYVMRTKIIAERRLLYIISGIGVAFSIVLLTIILGGYTPPLRTLFALPLAFAFMFFYIIKTDKKRIAVITTLIALAAAFYQAQNMAQLFYTDYMRYNDDVKVAYDLERLIEQAQHPIEKLPVVITGCYVTASRFKRNFLPGDALGLSFFGHNLFAQKHNTLRVLNFMATLGINYYNMPNTDQINRALELKEAIEINSYPDPLCVRNFGDFILVKLPEDDFDSAGSDYFDSAGLFW
jgi:hypothetical protein